MKYSIDFRKPIGKGANGHVYKGFWNNHPEMPVAVKRIPMNYRAMNEVNILKSLQNNASELGPIPQLYHVENTSDYCEIVMEYLSGGSLTQQLANQTTFKPEILYKILKDITTTLYICHCKNIVYGDMKPDNLMLTCSINDFTSEKVFIKTIDYGLSKKHPNASYIPSRFGTFTFMAPEVFRYEVSYPTDMWAAGMCMYIAITKTYPYELPTIHTLDIDTMKAIVDNQIISYHHPNWNMYDPILRKIVSGMLCLDPEKRISAQQILEMCP